MKTWHRAATRAEVERAGGLRVRVGGRWLALLVSDGRVHAITDACPHRGTSLAIGVVEGGFVSCLDHGWEYDLASGQGRCGYEGQVEVFAVEERGEEIWVEVGPAERPAWAEDWPDDA
jgi:nitrite reductase (NADH) small subunit